MWRVLKKLKIEPPYDPAIHSWAYIQRKHGSKGYVHPDVHCSAFYNSQDRETPSCPLTEDCIRKMLCKLFYMYTIEYYSAIKKNEIMPFAATGVDLQSVLLSEVSQTERNIV